MKYLLCQISLSAFLLAQSPNEAKKKAMCEAVKAEYTYLTDEPAQAYLQSVVNRMGQATILIVDEQEPWATYLLCRVVLVSKGFLQNASSERELAETISHMMAHSEQQPITGEGRISLFHRMHHPRSLSPRTLTPSFQQLEADANRRAAELLASFSSDPESTGLKAFQQDHPLPVRKKPTLYR